MDWKETKLSEITLKIASGSTPRGGKESYKESGITLIRSLNIYDFKFKYQNLAFIDDSQAKKLSNVIIEKNDILLNITGASVGRCTIVPKHLLPARINQHVMIIRIDKKLASANFILYMINSPQYKMSLMSLAETGATREALTKDDISNFKINLPPLKTQQKIASLLSSYDKLIENNTQRIKLLESMAEELYKEWFVRLRFPGHENVEVLDGVPEGWEKKEIISLAYINNNTLTNSTAPTYIKYLDIASVNTGFYGNPEQIEFELAPSRARRILKYGDTIFSTVRPNRKTYSLILEDNESLIASTGFAVITPKKYEYIAYIYLSVTHQSFVDSVVAKATGATYPAINQKSFERLNILVPTDKILTQFSTKALLFLELKKVFLDKNETLKQTRDLLLPRLMSGKLNVEDLDII